MSGIPTNGAQRASHSPAGRFAPVLAVGGHRRGRLIVIAQLAIAAMLVGLLPNLPPGPRGASAAGGPVLISVDTLRTRPMSGAAWTGLKATADLSVGTISLADHFPGEGWASSSGSAAPANASATTR